VPGGWARGRCSLAKRTRDATAVHPCDNSIPVGTSLGAGTDRGSRGWRAGQCVHPGDCVGPVGLRPQFLRQQERDQSCPRSSRDAVLRLAQCDRWRDDLVVVRDRSARGAHADDRLIERNKRFGGVISSRAGRLCQERHSNLSSGHELVFDSEYLIIGGHGQCRLARQFNVLLLDHADDGRLVEPGEPDRRLLISGRPDMPNRA
jgi:hypothetical protein